MDKVQILKALQKHYNFDKDVDFAQFLGISPQTLTNWISRSTFNYEILYTKCVGVSGDWLLGGDVPMFRSEKSYDDSTPEVLILNSSIEKRHDRQLIPIYNIEAAAGLVSLFNNPTGFTPIDFITLPSVGKVDGGLYAFGDSMYPLVKSGDIIVFRRLIDMFESIFYGEMYLLSYDLEGEEYIVIKYIQRSDKADHIKLVSQNQHHSPKDIPMSKVNALALVKASVRFNTIRPNS
jgi:phage repressor protein C with HTH and peptisase S24 domain